MTDSFSFLPKTFSRARATNTQLGEEQSTAYSFLEVYGEDGADVPPEIVVAPEDTVIVKGKPNTELHCIPNARPLHHIELQWFKDGRPIDQAGVPFSHNDLWNRTLSLIMAEFAHAGVYSCQVRTTTGGPILTREAKVTILEKPHFRSNLPVSTFGEFGRAINIPCDVHGKPEPNVTWYRNGIPLAETPNLRYEVIKKSNDDDSVLDERGPANSLHINFLRQEDSGMFQCSAANEAGDIVGYTWLRVKSKLFFPSGKFFSNHLISIFLQPRRQ